MARLKSELEVVCPCCQSTLVIDLNLGRVVSHQEPERGNKPELSDAHRLVAEEAARREAIFQQSVNAEKTRGDALATIRRGLKQANQGAGDEADEGLRSGLTSLTRETPGESPSTDLVRDSRSAFCRDSLRGRRDNGHGAV